MVLAYIFKPDVMTFENMKSTLGYVGFAIMLIVFLSH
ncbi:hypothetical protein LEQ_0435c [Ligilactobacillus equi DPC 6820]|uniref:Uncharacterized protein n=1 Tax=Ligilactobacillus equi DPC 6820 TaxID=1392007 RepID=V7HZ51_9LACO|nr:hypothetical protein LEQ_0435c [Ligilactobacillus equi DPC 6820]